MKISIKGLSFEEIVDVLHVGLSKLDLNSNLEGFEVDVIIPTLQYDVNNQAIENSNVITIRNTLTFIPTRYIILSQEGNGLITKTDTWTRKYLYLKNNGLEKVTLKVMFLK